MERLNLCTCKCNMLCAQPRWWETSTGLRLGSTRAAGSTAGLTGYQYNERRPIIRTYAYMYVALTTKTFF